MELTLAGEPAEGRLLASGGFRKLLAAGSSSPLVEVSGSS
jgi:hypothetical protein